MNTWPQFLTNLTIRIVLFACVLIAPSVCSAQVTNFAADTVLNLTDTKQATILITVNLSPGDCRLPATETENTEHTEQDGNHGNRDLISALPFIPRIPRLLFQPAEGDMLK